MKHFKIYYTSDVHGYLWPTDYIQKTEQNQGLINVAENYKKDGNTLIIDGGDMYQGSPLMQYLKKNDEDDVVSAMMNMAGYDYVTLGNHDFNDGFDVLKERLSHLNATVIAENVTDEQGNSLYPAQIKTLADGTKVGLIGLVTDYINIWEDPTHLAGVKIESPLIKAIKTIEHLREKTDIVIGIYHGGFERDLATGKVVSHTTENIAWQLTEKLDLDILLTAHQHAAVEPQFINDTLTLQLRNQATSYAEIDGEFTDDAWHFSAQINSAGEKSNADMKSVLQPINNKVEEWLDQPLARLSNPVAIEKPINLAQYGNDFLRLVAKVQLMASSAQITLQGLNNNPAYLPQEMTLRSILQNYPFDNSLVVKRVSGKNLRLALEHTARYFVIHDGQLAVNPDWLSPKVEHYNYDLVYGLTYTINVNHPFGKRITEFKYNGRDIADTDEFTVAMNNYRAVGGGDFPEYEKSETIWSGDQSVQDMIISYINQHRDLPAAPKLQLNVIY